MDFQNRVNSEVKTLIEKYERGEMELIDFAIEILSYAALESPDIAQRVNKILIGEKKPVGRPKTVESNEIHRLKANGLTQEAIARELNISLSTVRRELKNNFLKTQPVMVMSCGHQQCWGDGAEEFPRVGENTFCVWCQKNEKIVKVID